MTFFDVTMGSFDGAEMCELVGCYLLSLLTERYEQNIGLYRDNGLAVFNKMPQEIEKIKKELCKIFRENDLKITIEANKTIVNFLDVTLDLQTGKHYPFTKEGNVPLYVHKKSNLIHHLSLKTSQIPSTSGFPKYLQTDNALTTPKPCTKKHSIKVATITTCLTKSHTTRHSDHGGTVPEIFFGTTHLTARMSKRT